MLYFSTPLQNYDVDSFTMPLSVGSTSIFFRFAWPTEMQRQYDMQILRLNQIFKSMPFIISSDVENVIRRNFSFDLVASWQQFVDLWESGSSTTDIITTTIWPRDLKAELQAALADPTNAGLYNGIKTLLGALQPMIDYAYEIDEELIWTIVTEQGGERRVSCINPNTWLYQGFDDYRLCFASPKHRIMRNDLSETVLYVAIGAGDIYGAS